MKELFHGITGAATFFAVSILTPSHALAGNGGSDFSGALIGLLIVIIFFLVCREIMCWYWKINETVKLLTGIRESLQAIEQKISSVNNVKIDS